MGKSQAYRLIDSNEVIKNLQVESVPHGGQKNNSTLPNSEKIARELAKLPPEQQSEAWQKAIETAPHHNPSAAHTKAVVAEIINFPNKLLINDFAVDQLVQIKSDRSDKRLLGSNSHYGK